MSVYILVQRLRNVHIGKKILKTAKPLAILRMSEHAHLTCLTTGNLVQ